MFDKKKYFRDYYTNNKEYFKEQRKKAKVKCSCGEFINKYSMNRHLKTWTHHFLISV